MIPFQYTSGYNANNSPLVILSKFFTDSPKAIKFMHNASNRNIPSGEHKKSLT